MISFIVPTTGVRPSLTKTLASIELQPGDELLVVGPVTPAVDARARVIAMPNAHDWGATERTVGMTVATGTHLAFMDDDDVYTPCARGVMADALARTPERPVMFRLQYPNGFQLWRDPTLVIGNVSTQMLLLPNDPQKLGRWQSGRRECDFDFLMTGGWLSTDFAWRTDVICHRSEEKYEA